MASDEIRTADSASSEKTSYPISATMLDWMKGMRDFDQPITRLYRPNLSSELSSTPVSGTTPNSILVYDNDVKTAIVNMQALLHSDNNSIIVALEQLHTDLETLISILTPIPVDLANIAASTLSTATSSSAIATTASLIEVASLAINTNLISINAATNATALTSQTTATASMTNLPSLVSINLDSTQFAADIHTLVTGNLTTTGAPTNLGSVLELLDNGFAPTGVFNAIAASDNATAGHMGTLLVHIPSPGSMKWN
jgi:hypothetical protein